MRAVQRAARKRYARCIANNFARASPCVKQTTKKAKLPGRVTTLRSAELLGGIRVGGWDARVTT